MRIIKLNPKKSLSKGFLKQRPFRSEIELFKFNLIRLLDKIDEIEREENQKNHIRDFLRDTYYKETNEINTKDTKDLVIHLGKTNKDPVGVIIEAKRPGNKNEFLSDAKPNAKAFQELVLYYLRERIEENNIDIKYLIASNVYEWYIFEASFFEKHFYRNKAFVAKYEDWRDGKKVTKDTNLFYNDIAKPYINNLDEEIPCTYFDIRDYETILRNDDNSDDKNLIALQKLLSPIFLLKVKYANDNNSLDDRFYKELLHIIGLEEVKEKTKNIIRRKANKQSGSLIENAINILITEDSLYKLKDKTIFGQTKDEQLFGVALELSLTWINRILFLKLLEGQLITYHKGNEDYRFLNSKLIHDFDELYKLFHQVLARNIIERTPAIQLKYSKVPYLNSSLFEISELEDTTIKINSLDNTETIDLISTTILKDERNKNNSLPPLEYLFKFLEAYDFASEGGEDIAEDNKRIINASVLGKVFEKINGYKDGSIYTPGFITMYMSHQSLRLAVINKFNDYFRNKNIKEVSTFEELYNRVDKIIDIKTANEIINSLRVCDPAVGSGHFLVSILNELIAIKSELGILTDKHGKCLRDYEIVVDNDELIIFDDKGLFEYNYQNKESQRVQETIFNERQTIIENCLFGVDINPNSVKICRLRLWIELLKSSYYKSPDFCELETLPNIDINIKCGNSLVSRYSLESDLKKALQKSKWSIFNYRLAVMTYRNAKSKDEKREMTRLINEIKNNFETEIQLNDKRFKKLRDIKGDLYTLTKQGVLFDKSQKEKKAWNKKVSELTVSLKNQEALIEEIRNNVIYKNAFEWRFEFPEVLDDNGDFVGFDIVIGNPPYGVSIRDLFRTAVVDSLGKVPDFEIYYFFINLSKKILKSNGIKSYIIPNTILFNVFAKKFRESLFNNWQINEILDCTKFNIFEGSATVRCIITQFQKSESNDIVYYRPTANATSFDDLISRNLSKTTKQILLANNQNWALVFKLDTTILNLIAKIKNNECLSLNFDVSQGYIPYRKSDLIKIHGEKKAEHIVKNREWHSNQRKNIEYKQEIWGENLSKYSYTKPNSFVWYGNHLACFVDLKYFNQTRLLIREITNPTIIACIVKEELVNDPQIISIIPKTKKIGINILWALMNSKLATFYHFNSSPKATKGAFPKILVEDIKNFPLPEISDDKRKELLEKVNRIIKDQQNNNRSEIENQIDQMVYKLYQLTDEEIKIVEG